MEKIREYILDNKNFAKETIENFNKVGLLEVRGERYKRMNFLEEDVVLQDWLGRNKLSFIHTEKLNNIFFERTIFEQIKKTFDNMQNVYFMLKEAL